MAIAVSAGLGVGAERRWPHRADAVARRLLLFVVYAVLPFIIFFNLARASFGLDATVGLGIVYAALAVVAVAARLIAARMRLSRTSTGALINASVMGNSGYLGLPLTVVLLGVGSIDEAILFDTMVATPLLFIGGAAVGAAFGTEGGDTSKDRLKAFFLRNPPLWAAIAGFLAPGSLAPDSLVDVSHYLIVVMLPIGFFAVGTALVEERTEPGPARPQRGAVAAAVALKIAVAPALLVAFAMPFIDLPDVYLLLMAMPCGINSLISAHLFGLDHRLTATAIAWSTSIVVAASLVAVAIR